MVNARLIVRHIAAVFLAITILYGSFNLVSAKKVQLNLRDIHFHGHFLNLMIRIPQDLRKVTHKVYFDVEIGGKPAGKAQLK